MDDTPINLENILEQAPRWTFAGDYTLLQWMNQISQDLETRATKTTEALAKLNNNIRSTNIALDNVANSLTTLQFGNQFVECRVQDDDETITNGNEASSDGQKVQPGHTPTSKEILNTFLDNNLKVLRNCHEKYSIDLDDSDEEEEGKSEERTCIYQPINPYNERPLPYIFGSKDWHSKWHVGLYENQQENSYSGDEISEDFSESSFSSHLDDNESFESNTECASSNSIDIENLNTNIEIKNASSLRGSQPIYPVTSSILINAAKQNKATANESSSVSTPSSSAAKKSIRPTKQEEYLAQRAESINSTTSFKPTDEISSNNKENTLQYKTQPQTFVDLFAEPPEDLQSTISSTGSSSQNLIRPSAYNPTISTNRPSAFSTQPPPSFIDLFAEPPEDKLSSTTSSSVSSGQNIKRKTVNLFDDDDEDDMAKDDLLTVLTKKQELVKPKNEEKKTLPPAKTNIRDKPFNVSKTPKSLFEDSDGEDDDFLKAFVKKSSTDEVTKKTLTKTLLFDNESPQPSLSTRLIENDRKNNISGFLAASKENYRINKIQNIFDDPKDNEDDFLDNKTTKEEPENPKTAEDSKLAKTLETVSKAFDEPKEKGNVRTSENLFDDFGDIPKIDNIKTEKKSAVINLFDDFDDKDGDDLFSTKSKETSVKDIPQESSLKENVVKSSEIVKEENETVTRHSYPKEISKNSLTNTDSLHDKLSIEGGKENNIIVKNHDTKISRNNPEVIGNVMSVTENIVPANDEPLQVEDELHSTETLQVNEKLHSTSTLTESPAESTNYEKHNTDQKELDKNVISYKPATISTNDTQKQISSNKYDFNSVLFLDEPPEDDNEFFETLTKTPHTINTNYNVIDLENDIYEPELPNVPVAITENNITTSPETRQTNVYTGLQLFNDVPPDDDGANDDDNCHLATDINQTKRLHSVFYDDFNETLMALNQKQVDNEMPSHLIFSVEPPPINEESNSASSKDITDHKVPDVKQDLKLKGSENASKLEESLSKSDNKFGNISSSKHPVSKLQMPHININVQALLPVTSNTLRKAKEDATKSQEINQNNDDFKSALTISTEKEKTNQYVEVPRTAETEHILPSVTKNRVKAPAARRPSTRRARHENYRKSLMEDQQTLESDNETNEIHNGNTGLFLQPQAKISICKNSTKQIEPNNTIMIKKEINNDILKGITKTKRTTEEKTPVSVSIDVDDANISKTIKSKTMEVKSKNKILKVEPPKYSESSSSIQNIKNPKSKKDSSDISENKSTTKATLEKRELNTKISLLFDDVDDDEDDLFKHIKRTKTNINETTTNENESKAKTTLQSDSDTFNTINEVTKDIAVPSTLNTEITCTTNENKTTIKPDPEKQQPTKVLTEAKKPKQIETKTKFIHQSLTNKAKSSFLDDTDGEEYDEDLFKNNIQRPTTSLRKKDNNNKAKAQFKSFLDSESDEEDFNVAGLQSSKSTKPITATSTKTSNICAPTPKKTSTKLFTGSDTDSDDLFGKPASTKTPYLKISTETTTKIQTKPQPKSFFLSDENESDDFLTSSASVSKNRVSKNPLKETKLKANASLFSDIDSDEDDLFGSGASNVTTITATNISKVNIPSTSKSILSAVEVSRPKTVADNPLADLL